MSARITAVVPAYDRADTLPEALDSALAQDFDGLEIVVVDDGSTDATPDILSDYAARHPAVVRVHRQVNAGQSAALNRGVELASAPLIAWLDSDDAWLPGKLSRAVPRLEAEADAALLYAAVEYMDADGAPIPAPRAPRREPEGDVLDALLRENFIRTPTVVFRRDLYRSAGGYDPTLKCLNDWDLWLRFAVAHRFLRDPEPSARYRLHGDQAVRDRRRMAVERVLVLERHLPLIERDAPRHARRARRELGRRLLKLARLDLRTGDDAAAGPNLRRAVRLVPSLRLEAFRIRVVERLKR